MPASADRQPSLEEVALAEGADRARHGVGDERKEREAEPVEVGLEPRVAGLGEDDHGRARGDPRVRVAHERISRREKRRRRVGERRLRRGEPGGPRHGPEREGGPEATETTNVPEGAEDIELDVTEDGAEEMLETNGACDETEAGE